MIFVNQNKERVMSKEKVKKLFDKYVHPMMLLPRLAGSILKAMTKADRRSKGNAKEIKAAIPAYLESKGYDAKGNKKAKKKGKRGVKKTKAKKIAKPAKEAKTKATKVAKASKAPKGAKDPVKEILETKGGKKALKGSIDAGVPKGNIDLRRLDRSTMKGMAKDLDVTYKKAMSDDELRSALAAKMIGVDATLTAAMKNIDTVKVDALNDCIGIAIDLTKAICITCPAQEDCRKLFELHRADGWKIFQTLKPDAATDIDVPKEALTKKPKKAKEEAPAFNAKQELTLYEVGKVATLPTVEIDGGKVDNSEHKAFLIAVKKGDPATLGDFRDLVLAHYTADDDDKDGTVLTQWFVRYCVALNMIDLA